jgi:hypothetical protein
MLKWVVFYRGGVLNGQQVFLLWKRKGQRIYCQPLPYKVQTHMETERSEGQSNN